MTFEALPMGAMYNLVKFMGVEDVCTLSQVSHKMRQATQQSLFEYILEFEDDDRLYAELDWISKNCSTITVVDLSKKPNWENRIFDSICRMHQLRALNLCNVAEFTDDDLEKIAENLPNLVSLQIDSPILTSDAIPILSDHFKNLKSLGLIGTERMGEGIESILEKHPKLEELTLNKLHLTPEVKKALGELKSLRVLDLRDTDVSDADLQELLPKLRSLQAVRLGSTTHEKAMQITDKTLESLSKNYDLRELGLYFVDITLQGLEKIVSRLPDLNRVALTSCPFGDDAAKILAEHTKKLSALDLQYAAFSTVGLEVIKKHLPHAIVNTEGTYLD